MVREKILARQFEMIPASSDQSKYGKVVKEGSEEEAAPPPAVDKWYSIDNDNYEVKPVRVTLLPDAIKMFTTLPIPK